MRYSLESVKPKFDRKCMRSADSARIMRHLWLLAACLTIGGAGCASQHDPLTVEVTQLAPYEHAAKPPDCQMPVLTSMPLTDYEQIAIVEAWADLKDQPSDVMPALQREACETGADALVVIDSTHQDIKNLLYRATPNEAETEIRSRAIAFKAANRDRNPPRSARSVPTTTSAVAGTKRSATIVW